MKRNSSSLITCYYLLYKLKNNEILWIVKASDNIYDLKDHVNNFSSYIETYYIVSEQIPLSDCTLNIKQFTKFSINNNIKLHYETTLY